MSNQLNTTPRLSITALDGKEFEFTLADVGAIYESDDVIYIAGHPCRISSFRVHAPSPTAQDDGAAELATAISVLEEEFDSSIDPDEIPFVNVLRKSLLDVIAAYRTRKPTPEPVRGETAPDWNEMSDREREEYTATE